MAKYGCVCYTKNCFSVKEGHKDRILCLETAFLAVKKDWETFLLISIGGRYFFKKIWGGGGAKTLNRNK